MLSSRCSGHITSEPSRAAAATHRPNEAASRAPAATPRYLHTAPAAGGETIVVQRQEAGSPSAVPRFQLTPPSLLQPRDPYARYLPDLGRQLRLDPELELRMLALGRTLLSPANVLAHVGAVTPAIAAGPAGLGAQPGPRRSMASSAASGGAGGPAPAPTPAQPPGTPAAPAPVPSPEAEPPRPGSGGDVLSAVIALPQVSLLLEDVQGQFTSGFSRYWRGASLGEQVGFVGGSVVVGSAILAPVLGYQSSRDFVLPLLNDVVIPVPGLSGYGLEFRFGERDVMIGAHLDVGRLLPSLWGFGEASFQPIGGPPGSDPSALPPPPVSRKETAQGAPPESTSLASRVRAARGKGAELPEPVRERFEASTRAQLPPVRLHTDGEADRLARDSGALALTSGRDIFFRAGAYDPDSSSGARLLAHELTHTQQQARGMLPSLRLGAEVRMGVPGDALEQEADRVAEAATGPGPRSTIR